MARAKLTKKVVKKQDVPGNLQKRSSSTFDGKETGDHGDIPSNILSTIAQKSVVHTIRTVKSSSVLPETTPASHRGRAFHTKKLTDVFSKLPNDISSAVDDPMIEHENVFLTSTPKEREAVSVPANIQNKGSAVVAKTATGTKRSADTEQEETAEPSVVDGAESPIYSRKQEQRTINFYYYPVEDTRKWIRNELAKPPPRKRTATKKQRAPTTDEMSEVLLWQSPSRRKRTLKDLTDLEVAYTIFKRTVLEFSDCVSDRSITKFIEKYGELVERSVVKKLQEIEDVEEMQRQIKELDRENKGLSSDLGHLIRRKMRLQHKVAKRRKPDQE